MEREETTAWMWGEILEQDKLCSKVGDVFHLKLLRTGGRRVGQVLQPPRVRACLQGQLPAPSSPAAALPHGDSSATGMEKQIPQVAQRE